MSPRPRRARNDLRSRRPRRVGLLLDAFLIVVAAALLLQPGGVVREWLDGFREDRAQRERARDAWPALVEAGGRLGDGGTEAPALVVFTDYRCPFCERAQHALDSLLAAPSGESAPTVVVRHLPVDARHPDASLLSGVAVCAEGTPAFPRVHRALYRAPPGATAGELRRHLAAAGIDAPGLLLDCTASPRTGERLATDRRLALRLGARGTPTFVGPDGLRTGALSVAALREMLVSADR